MSQDIYDKYADLEARIRQIESKNQQRLSVAASTTASKNTNVNNAAGIAIDWNIGADTAGIIGTLFSHSTSTNPTRITVNRSCAARLSCSTVVAATVTDSAILIYFRLNGSTAMRGRGMAYISNASGHVVSTAHLYRTYPFVAGDYIEIMCLRYGAAGTVTLFGTTSVFDIEEVFQ